jgi:hypothetical protein
MTRPRWTQRRNGQEMATVRVTYHVPRAMVDWLTTHSTMATDTAALRWLRPHLAELHDGWHALSASADGEPVVVDVDNITWPDDDSPPYVDDGGTGVKVYDGPGVTGGT